MQLVLINPLLGPYQVLPFRDKGDLGAIASSSEAPILEICDVIAVLRITLLFLGTQMNYETIL